VIFRLTLTSRADGSFKQPSAAAQLWEIGFPQCREVGLNPRELVAGGDAAALAPRDATDVGVATAKRRRWRSP
jgi:hypothetical protein